MIYSLLVLSSPISGHGARHAAEFARCAIARGHCIFRVFFLDQGTLAGSANTIMPQDATHPAANWLQLRESHGVELVICITSALRHGMLDSLEAERHERAATVLPEFTIAGLGQLIEACTNSDRMMTFGG